MNNNDNKNTYYWKIFYNDENLKNSKFHTGKFSMYSSPTPAH